MLASIAILTLFGLLLLMLETFLPGWVAGILGVISIGVAVCLSLTADELAAWPSWLRLLLALGIVAVSAAVMLAWLRWFAVKFLRRSLTLTTSIDARLTAETVDPGTRGTAVTALRPLGRAEFGGRRYEVRCQSGIADAGSPVEVVASEPGNLLVKLI